MLQMPNLVQKRPTNTQRCKLPRCAKLWVVVVVARLGNIFGKCFQLRGIALQDALKRINQLH